MSFKEYIEKDRKRCEFLVSRKSWLRVWFLREHEYYIWKYQKLLRKEEFYAMKHNAILSTYYRIRKNKRGRKLGFTIHKFVFAQGLRIWHFGNITVNAEARVGENCTLHGDNCIGNNGKDNRCPRIGNNVELGVGAKIIGDVTLGDNVIIGAGAIVTRSFPKGNVVLAGVPAKVIRELK